MFCVVTVSLLFNSNLYLYHITLSYFVIKLSLVAGQSSVCDINNNNNYYYYYFSCMYKTCWSSL